VAETTVKPYNQSIANRLIGPLAQNNHFLVTFSTLTPSVEAYLARYTRIRNVKEFLSNRAGILCSDASLPTSTLATAEVKDNFMGVPQQFAHTRFYTDIDFSFYIDEDYTLLKIFEGWMEYISSGSNNFARQDDQAYYRRMRYPDSYKCNSMFINKFEKNYKKTLRYRFVNVFPKAISPVPVAYGPSDILKVSVSFNYDRYIVNG
jgi:hypothetical protein|tara:strand:- start:3691 stop:4305 length:615 start_codon:yes stop_codon:yes gene_type:complete